MKEIKEIKAMDDYVVLKMHTKKTGKDPYKKLKSGILIANEEPEAGVGSSKIELDFAEIYDIGKNVENSFQKGDHVIFNEYDIKYVGSAENMYGVLKASNIMAVYESGEETEE